VALSNSAAVLTEGVRGRRVDAGHLSRTGRSHLVPDTGSGGAGDGGLPSFDTVQYLNAHVRPMLVDALVKVGRERPKQPSKAFATAVAAR
jgi:hypothetical protein